MSDLERELEQELHRVLDPIAAMPMPARRKPQARAMPHALFGGAGAALGLKLLTVVAVAGAAVTVAGVTTTGSVNPVSWGHEVQQEVKDISGHRNATPTNEAPSPANSNPRDNPGSHSVNAGGSGNSQANGDNNAGGQGSDQGKDHPKDHAIPPTEKDPADPPMHPPAHIPPAP